MVNKSHDTAVVVAPLMRCGQIKLPPMLALSPALLSRMLLTRLFCDTHTKEMSAVNGRADYESSHMTGS